MKSLVLLVAMLAFALSFSTPAWAADKTRAAKPGKSAQQPAGTVNINTASLGELMLLPNVGPATAQAILTYRAKHKFRRKEQLIRVRGIGVKSLHRLRPYITVRGPTTLTEKVKIKR